MYSSQAELIQKYFLSILSTSASFHKILKAFFTAQVILTIISTD